MTFATVAEAKKPITFTPNVTARFALDGGNFPEPSHFFTDSGMEGINTFLVEFEMRKYRLKPKSDSLYLRLVDYAPNGNERVVQERHCPRRFMAALGEVRASKMAESQRDAHLRNGSINPRFAEVRHYRLHVGITTNVQTTDDERAKRCEQIAILIAYRIGLHAAHEAITIAECAGYENVADFIREWRSS